jgi:hypothetical protein
MLLTVGLIKAWNKNSAQVHKLTKPISTATLTLSSTLYRLFPRLTGQTRLLNRVYAFYNG